VQVGPDSIQLQNRGRHHLCHPRTLNTKKVEPFRAVCRDKSN
jgi:hypothetical protein